MSEKKKVIILSNSEICYNPRLAKAADSLCEQGYEVDVFNPIVGMADLRIYYNFIKNKKWNIREFDISKRNLKSKIRWFVTGITNKLFLLLYKRFDSKIGFEFIKNKGLIGFKKNKKIYDIIIIHLVDSLPFAVKLKKKYPNSVLIYDSQEFFTGQYSKSNIIDRKWVNYAEKKYINSADIILATTNVMSTAIAKKYNLPKKPIRVRNLPYDRNNHFSVKTNEPIKLIWHGMRIVFENRRGLHILLKAVSKTKENVKFYIQGLISSQEKEKIDAFLKENNIQNKVIILPPAKPDKIVQSLIEYDIGIIGELPEEENQMFTSSNKLFEFISAGLAVIMPDVPGLRETKTEYGSYELYPPGNFYELAQKIDTLAKNRAKLDAAKNVSKQLAHNTLFWNNDYKYVLSELSSI